MATIDAVGQVSRHSGTRDAIIESVASYRDSLGWKKGCGIQADLKQAYGVEREAGNGKEWV